MHDLDFGKDRLPFRPTNNRDILADPVILGAIRSAMRRGVANYDLTKWLRGRSAYLKNMYTFDEKLVQEYGSDYIWTVLLAYMMACEASVTDTANFFSPYLPYALADADKAKGSIDVEALFVLHTAAYAHALLYPLDPAKRSKMLVSNLTDALMMYAIGRLSRAYRVAEHPTPNLVTDKMFPEAALEATNNFRRWGLNIMNLSTIFVTTHAKPQRSAPKRKKPRKKK